MAKKGKHEINNLLENYPDICKLELEDLGEMEFEERLGQIYASNGKKTHLKKA